MIRLYIPQDLLLSSTIELAPEASHYLVTVMRRRSGDEILLFNGRDGEFRALITDAHKKKTNVTITEQTRPFINPPKLILVFSPLKPKIMEFLIKKGTELGVTDFMPVRMRQSSPHRASPEKWERYAIEAAEQCERVDIPHIHAITSLDECLKNWDPTIPLYIGDETHSSPKMERNHHNAGGFMVGPEGGFHPDELSKLKAFSFSNTVNLRPTILRAETAALAGIVLIR